MGAGRSTVVCCASDYRPLLRAVEMAGSLPLLLLAVVMTGLTLCIVAAADSPFRTVSGDSRLLLPYRFCTVGKGRGQIRVIPITVIILVLFVRVTQQINSLLGVSGIAVAPFSPSVPRPPPKKNKKKKKMATLSLTSGWRLESSGGDGFLFLFHTSEDKI